MVLHLGEVEHVRDHACQTLQFFGVGREDLSILCRFAVLREHHLGLGEQIRDRRAQFVRNIRRKFREPPEIVL